MTARLVILLVCVVPHVATEAPRPMYDPMAVGLVYAGNDAEANIGKDNPSVTKAGKAPDIKGAADLSGTVETDHSACMFMALRRYAGWVQLRRGQLPRRVGKVRHLSVQSPSVPDVDHWRDDGVGQRTARLLVLDVSCSLVCG